MYDIGKAFEIESHRSTVPVCEIERGKCPYGNEHHRLECPDGETRTICKTEFKVQEKGKLQELVRSS